MNRYATVLALLATGSAAVAQAQTFVDQARVQRVEPQYENVTVPRQECTTQWVTEPRAAGTGNVVRDYAPALIGGVAGAALGRQVGKGSGRDIATVVGAVAGAYAGNSYGQGALWGQQQPQYEQRQVQQCHTVNDVQRRLSGYRVHYDYRGQQHTTVLREQPGAYLPVRVSVEPVQSTQTAWR
ncbi:glycine zipper 2TM domain-containing protein [Ramlibacter rhizophilus]|uniref:Glycine zipper 2TM domain-containing protein n=1 Tax=Ramlibacter rhizophilus TaxID=1781167 RepID=A0A4Z0BDN4_9BURK|nr:glycine zipper 2TM domain-containing protein [Ramlibacter rhizophilus]TFY96791.1 glycine zipper 2TM domain-containing protein [Ramlibacter rhizophilus]